MVGELHNEIEPAHGANQNIQDGDVPKVTHESVATAAGLSEHQRKTAARGARTDIEPREGDHPRSTRQSGSAGLASSTTRSSRRRTSTMRLNVHRTAPSRALVPLSPTLAISAAALPRVERCAKRRGKSWLFCAAQVEYAMAKGQAKLLYPGLAGFYEAMLPIAATFMRIVVGIMFLAHVSAKFQIGAAAVATNVLAKNGIEPALMWGYVIMFLELVGGLCLTIGLFTRFFAAALAIEMLIALLFVHLPKGYAAGAGGYEYVLLIGAVCFTIAMRGGGVYSVDRLIGKEL